MKGSNTGISIILLICILPDFAWSQSAIEHHVWQDRRSFKPFSSTAKAITGNISLSGNSHFAIPGAKMELKFANGKSVLLTSIQASWRRWDDADSELHNAEAYHLQQDPGALKNANTLCGDPVKHSAKYIVFYETTLMGQTPLLGMNVFDSSQPPKDIGSPGLCATFSFEVK